MAPAGEGAEANREKSCAICAVGFGASVWRYHCTDCRHSFCSSHCKDLWAQDDDVEEGEEDPFTVLKQDAVEDPPPELVGDGAPTASASLSVSASSASSLAVPSGSKPGSRLLCIECYAPRRTSLLRAELYDTLDELEELEHAAVQAPEGGSGAWYVPSLAAISPAADVVASGASVVKSAVGKGVGMGYGLLSNPVSSVIGGGNMVWGAARNVANTAVSVVPTAEAISAAPTAVKKAVAAPSALLSAPSSVLHYFSSVKSAAHDDDTDPDDQTQGRQAPHHTASSDKSITQDRSITRQELDTARSGMSASDSTDLVGAGDEGSAGHRSAQTDGEAGERSRRSRAAGAEPGTHVKVRQEIVPQLSSHQQAAQAAQLAHKHQLKRMQQHRARVGVLEAEIAELQQRVDMAEAARTKAWLTVTLPTETDVWYAGYEGVLAWQSQGVVRRLSVRIGTYMGSYVSAWHELVSDLPDTGHVTLQLPPNTPAGWYCLRVTSAGGFVDATSDYFLLQSAPGLTASIRPAEIPATASMPHPAAALAPVGPVAERPGGLAPPRPAGAGGVAPPDADADALQVLVDQTLHRGQTYTIRWRSRDGCEGQGEVVLVSSDSEADDADSVGSGDVIDDPLTKLVPSPHRLPREGGSGAARDRGERPGGGDGEQRGSSSESDGDLDPGLLENAALSSARERFLNLNVSGDEGDADGRRVECGGVGASDGADGGGSPARGGRCGRMGVLGSLGWGEGLVGDGVTGAARGDAERSGDEGRGAAAEGGEVTGGGDIGPATLVHSTCTAAMAIKGQSQGTPMSQETLQELRRRTIESELVTLAESKPLRPTRQPSLSSSDLLDRPDAASVPAVMEGGGQAGGKDRKVVLEFSSCYGRWRTIALATVRGDVHASTGLFSWTVPPSLDQVCRTWGSGFRV